MSIARFALPLALLSVAGTWAGAEEPRSGKPAYPETRREEAKDVLHGQDVLDPYRWLEDDDSKEVEAWDRAQLALLRARLDATPGREELKSRLEKELDLGGIESLPHFAGAWEYHTYRAPGENHEALYRRDAAGKEPPMVVIDPNAWSEDGTQGLGDWWPSPDGRYLAYGRDAKGSEDITLYVRDVDAGTDLPDVITRTKFTSVVWRADGRSFYYERLPDPADVPAAEVEYHRRVRLHVLGTLVVDDPVIYGQGRPMLESPWVGTSTDEQHRFLVRGIPYETLDTFEIVETWGEPRLEPILVGNDSRTYVDRVGDLYVLNTDYQAPRRRICVATKGRTENPLHWKTIVPESEDVIESVWLAKDRLVVQKRENLAARLSVVALDGTPLGQVALPSDGAVGSLATKPGDPRLWFTFEAYNVPLSTWVVDLSQEAQGTGAAARFAPTRLATIPTTLRIDELVSERLDLPSKDGTKIPVYVLRSKHTPLDGSAPTLLYGYGGFRVGLYPRFSRSMAVVSSASTAT
jgi:prolyl oligopeptidase